ncbi:MAG: acyl-ACP--UDP-N-acetylglucosamine O-acyltransferase [Bdellovibrionota bacterium]|nr:MAG: acyl-ACP--UDP-N-acetylglucosamine O-acyltransferase [Bdellovibrionota bacterium]
MAGVQVHPSAIVAPSAVIGDGSIIGPYCVVGPHVRLGQRCTLHSHVVIEGFTECGDENQFFPFGSIGLRPQDLKYKGEQSRLVLGNANVIREYVTLQPGTAGGGMLTHIGDRNLFMANSHLGHDGNVGDANIIANSCALAGHVTVGSHAVIGGLCAIHQFVRIGDFAMLGGGAMVERDVPPCGIAQGDRAKLLGVNTIGLSRNGFAEEEIAQVKRLYRELFFSGQSSFEARLEAQAARSAPYALVSKIIEFCRGSSRGITPSRRMTEEGNGQSQVLD